jgi:hypothetical protein
MTPTMKSRVADMKVEAADTTVRSQISQLFLLLKSGKLSEEERKRLRDKIAELQFKLESDLASAKSSCCKK